MIAVMSPSERHRFAVVVHVLVTSDAGILLLRRRGTGIADGCWAPPGGHLEAGETPRAAAVREVREELGLTLAPDAIRPAALFHFAAAGGGLNLIFRAALPGAPAPAFDPGGADAAGWWPEDSLPQPVVPWLPAALARHGDDWYGEFPGA